MPSLREMLAEQRKQEAAAAAKAAIVLKPVATAPVHAIPAEMLARKRELGLDTSNNVAAEDILGAEPGATAGGYVPSTDALRVAAKMLTGKTVRGSGADARRAIDQWNRKVPKARKQH